MSFFVWKMARIWTTLCRNDQPPLHIVRGVIEVPWDIFNLPRELTSLAIMQFTAPPPSTKYIISSWRKGKDFDFVKNNNSIFNPSQQTNDLFVCTEIFPKILLSTTMSGNNLKPDVKKRYRAQASAKMCGDFHQHHEHYHQQHHHKDCNHQNIIKQRSVSEEGSLSLPH